MIIDSPGVGESEKMDQILMSYLPKAFAFIYVINSANAGGIQRDRVSIKELFSNEFLCCMQRPSLYIRQNYNRPIFKHQVNLSAVCFN